MKIRIRLVLLSLCCVLALLLASCGAPEEAMPADEVAEEEVVA